MMRYWPIIVAVVAIAAAWGETRLAVAQNTSAREQSQDQRVQAARVEERVQSVQQAQERQEAALERQETLLLEIIQRLPPR